jgi:hypothetical protein
MILVYGFDWSGMALMLFILLLILVLLAMLFWVVLRLLTWEMTVPVSPDADTQQPDPSAGETLYQCDARDKMDAMTDEQARARSETLRTQPPGPSE